MPGAAGPLGAGAGPAVLPGAQRWVPKVSGRTPAGWRSAGARAAGSTLPRSRRTPHLPLAPLAIRVVAAAQAAARPGVTVFSVPIALATPADGKAPVAGLAAVAACAMGTLTAGALPRGTVADCAHRPLAAALARWKARHPQCQSLSCRKHPSPVPPALGCLGSSPGWDGTALRHSPRHPLGPKPKVPGEQRWQRRPTMLGLHWHCPPWGRHSALSEPWGSQRQAAGREGVSTGCCRAQDRVQYEAWSCTHAAPRHAGWPRGCAGGWSRAQPRVRAPRHGRAGRSGTAQRSAGAPWSWGRPR